MNAKLMGFEAQFINQVHQTKIYQNNNVKWGRLTSFTKHPKKKQATVPKYFWPNANSADPDWKQSNIGLHCRIFSSDINYWILL